MECLGKVSFFAILPCCLCNGTWLCSSHWSFQSSARIWVRQCSMNAHFPLAVSKTLGRKGGISKTGWMYQLPKQHVQLGQWKRSENRTLNVCFRIKPAVSRAKPKHRARGCWYNRFWALEHKAKRQRCKMTSGWEDTQWIKLMGYVA